MHPGKTKLILFGSKSKLRKIKDFTVTCEGQVTKASTSVKYLGITLNQFLSGEEIVKNFIKKVNSRVKFLYRQASYLDSKTKTLISTNVLCHFDYLISLWCFGLSKARKNKLKVAQNKAIRLF